MDCMRFKSKWEQQKGLTEVNANGIAGFSKNIFDCHQRVTQNGVWREFMINCTDSKYIPK